MEINGAGPIRPQIMLSLPVEDLEGNIVASIQGYKNSCMIQKLACVAGGFGGRESQAKAAGEMGR